MGIGGGIVLAAIGAILYFAVEVDAEGINIPTIGIILMVAGVVIALWSAFASRRTTSSSTTVRRSDGTVEERSSTVKHDDPQQT